MFSRLPSRNRRFDLFFGKNKYGLFWKYGVHMYEETGFFFKEIFSYKIFIIVLGKCTRHFGILK